MTNQILTYPRTKYPLFIPCVGVLVYLEVRVSVSKEYSLRGIVKNMKNYISPDFSTEFTQFAM